MARARKLTKEIEGTVITIVETETNTTLKYDVSELDATIQGHLTMHGASQKLGDACAGRSGQDAVDSMEAVWASMVEGKWSTRKPAAPKVTKKSIMDKYESIVDPEQRAMAKELLESLGLL